MIPANATRSSPRPLIDDTYLEVGDAPMPPSPANWCEVSRQESSRTSEHMSGLQGNEQRTAQDTSCVKRNRVGLGALAALAVVGGTVATLGGVFGSRAANRRSDITYGEVLAGSSGGSMPPGNVFAGKLRDDAFLSAMTSVFQGPPVTFESGEKAERYASYFREAQIDRVMSDDGKPAKLAVRLPVDEERGDCLSEAKLVAIDQGALKRLIKDSDPKEPTLLHPVGVRALEQAMVQQICAH
jgi:hypothetical protein